MRASIHSKLPSTLQISLHQQPQRIFGEQIIFGHDGLRPLLVRRSSIGYCGRHWCIAYDLGFGRGIAIVATVAQCCCLGFAISAVRSRTAKTLCVSSRSTKQRWIIVDEWLRRYGAIQMGKTEQINDCFTWTTTNNTLQRKNVRSFTAHSLSTGSANDLSR